MRREKKAMAVFLAGTMLISSILLPASMEGKSKKPTLNKKKITTTIGKTVKVKVKKAKGYKITWKSQKKKLATVKKAGKYAAKIKAKKSGTVKIIAKVKKGSRKYNLTCKVKIKKANTPVVTPVSTEQSVTKPSTAPVSTTLGASAVTKRTGSPAVETDSTSGQSTDIPASTLPEESVAAPTDSTSTEPTDKGDVTPGIQPTGGTVVAPTDSGVTNPTDNPDVKPTDNTGTKPTDNTGTKPTVSSGTKPTGSGTLPTAGTVETAAPTNDPTSAVEGGELTLSKETFLLSACTEGDPIYNEDGSVTITIKGENGGGGIAFALDSAKTEVKLSDYEKVIFEVSAEEETKLCFNYHPTTTYWDKQPIGNTTVSTSKVSYSCDLSARDGNTKGFGVQYYIPADANSTRTVTIHSITLVPKAEVTAAPTPTKKATPTPVATLPSTAIELALTKDMLLTSACVDGTPTYNEDGSVTVTLKGESGGGGIGFYINPSKTKVKLSDYGKVIFEVSAVEATALGFNYHPTTDYWGKKPLGYDNVSTSKELYSFDLKAQEGNAMGFGVQYNAGNDTNSTRTVTIHSITLMPDEKDITEAMNYTSLAELASDYNLKMGTVMNVNKVADRKYKELTSHHFNSITAANEMKAYSLLNQDMSIAEYKKPDGDGMPKMKYDNADKIMNYAKENGIKVRGHVLVWDADMCDWFFREGYESNGDYVSKETLQARVKSYINDVMNYFQENYPGVIYCWDVVNEAVGDSKGTDYRENDDRHVRTHRNGVENQFYKIMGDHYVEESFWYAREVLDGWEQENKIEKDSIKLYYNDYSTYVASKRDAIIELVKSINSYKQDANGQNKKLCDGVGMQSYIGGWYGPSQQHNCMKDSDIDAIKTAITKFGDLGVEVQVTELAVRSWSNTDEETAKHAAFYKKLMQAYLDLSTKKNGPLTAVSIWGLYDDSTLTEKDYSYRMNGTYCGLFTETCGVKDSFKSVYEVLGGTVNGQ